MTGTASAFTVVKWSRNILFCAVPLAPLGLALYVRPRLDGLQYVHPSAVPVQLRSAAELILRGLRLCCTTQGKSALSCRFVFNRALALQQERHERAKKLGYAGLCKELTGWRNGAQVPSVSDAPIHPLQQTLKDLARVYANFLAVSRCQRHSRTGFHQPMSASPGLERRPARETIKNSSSSTKLLPIRMGSARWQARCAK